MLPRESPLQKGSSRSKDPEHSDSHAECGDGDAIKDQVGTPDGVEKLDRALMVPA